MTSTPQPPPGASTPSVKGAALIGKAFDLLNIIGAAGAPISGAELAARSGMPRASVYRVLSALTAAGYARLDSNERGYVLGFRLLELAQNAREIDNLAAVAAPELRRLRDITGETGYLFTLDKGAAVSLGRFESPHAHRSIGKATQGRRSLDGTAHGKAMLAFMPAAEADLLTEASRLTQMTPSTITDPDELRSHLADIRAHGFAIDDEEVLVGIRAVGAAILGHHGRVLGGISVAGPVYRLTPARAQQLGQEIRAAARQISRLVAEARPPTTDGAGAQPLGAAPQGTVHGTSPIWDEAGGRLIWADALTPAILATDASGACAALPTPPAPATALLLGPNGPIALAEGAIIGADAAGALHARAAPNLKWATALRTARDGEVWAARRIEGEAGAVIGPLRAGRIAPIWRTPGQVTALAWDHERGTLYAVAEAEGTIHALRKGAPARLLSRIPAASGAPSAVAVDVEGRVWAALLDGWGVVRLTEFGDVDATLALPVPRPTGLAFGGPGFRTLYITTSREGLSKDAALHAPLSGRVFALGTGVPGWAEPIANLSLG